MDKESEQKKVDTVEGYGESWRTIVMSTKKHLSVLSQVAGPEAKCGCLFLGLILAYQLFGSYGFLL